MSMVGIEHLQGLYDRNRFLEAYRESAEYWKPAQRLKNLSVDELILGGRLAARLGGLRLSRWIFRAALNRAPSDPRVRYFTNGLPRRGWNLFGQLREWELDPELPGAEMDTRAHWSARQAVMWASLRDFNLARRAIEQARACQPKDSWVLCCESYVYGQEDRWAEALKSAELAWKDDPGTPFGAQCLGQCLLSLGRIREAAERLATAAEDCESFEVTQAACWHLCALAETVEGDERGQVLQQARGLAERLPALAPLADRETRTLFARARLDVAELEDDHEAMERWAKELRSPFHRKVLENLRKNPTGVRIRLPFRRAIQKHETCLPTSVASALTAMGTQIDPDAMAAEITFGGTAEWAAAEWLEKRGFVVRFFAVRPDIAVSLIKNGIAFVVTLEADASAHAVAVVGLDEAAGTLIVHDPMTLRAAEYLLESIGRDETPLGPKGMVIVPREKAGLVDSLLPADDVAAITATESHHRALVFKGPMGAREVVERLADKQPTHPVTRFLKALQAIEDGRVGVALLEFQELLRAFPGSALVRAKVLSSSRSLGNTALMRATLESVVERGMLPGIQSQQSWRYPPSAYVSEYADLLRASAESRERARSLLYGVILRENTCAHAWHVLGDLLWDERDMPGALLGYRIGACLGASNEHYARAYCDALADAGRQAEGLQWLENRARGFGVSPYAIVTWITWIGALEDWGHPERAVSAAEEAINLHGNSADLLAFVVPFSARMGRWEEAETLLGRLEAAGNSALFHEASTNFYRRRGALEKALEHVEAWARESPLSMPARGQWAQLIAKRDGVRAALERAHRWRAEQPGHDELEQLYCQYLDQNSTTRWKKYGVLLRRLKRNAQDGWAWRELAFGCIADYESKDERGRKKLERRIERYVQQCMRTAPQDASTFRVRALWCEARGERRQSIEHWMASIQREPDNSYSYGQVWECLARSDAEQRKQAWQKISEMLLSNPGRLVVARQAAMLAAQRFGVAEAEQSVANWKKMRADDPEVTEAYADLLLEWGHGRSDAQRALDALQPAAQRFPYHYGLRFSLADAFRRLGKFKEAEEVLAEIIRRHPDNSLAQIQLARMQERGGRIDDALQTLASAAGLDPQNADIRDVQAQVLIGAGRYEEARRAIQAAMLSLEENVNWWERAITLLAECGDEEAAVRVARDGVRVYPRGAYLWFLLGRTLSHLRRFAAQGEIEACLRRSLTLNQGLYLAADWLAMLLVEQRRYDEAAQAISQIRDRLGDPAPAQGRLAWIRRQKGDRLAAREEMVSLLGAEPWYTWGWLVVLEWLVEDNAWKDARSLLASTPAELRTNTNFRRQRLIVLEKAGLSAAELDSEWNSLLLDFPEDVSLHLFRYDSLRNGKRLPEAKAVLEQIRPIDPESPYVLARYVEVLAAEPKRKDEAIESSFRILFGATEESTWPADYAWKAMASVHLEQVAYQKAFQKLRQGARPTLHALFLLAACAMQPGKTKKWKIQPHWRTWFPDRGAREILTMLEAVEAAQWSKAGYRATLLKQLCDVGYDRLVVKYWNANEIELNLDTDSWAQTGRALVDLKRKGDARKFLEQWRGRTGVGMWIIANYLMCLSALRTKQLREALSCCRDALAGLPHDHCAKYVVHRQAEACALLGDQKAFLETWNEYRNYFDCKVEGVEWFEPKRKHLLTDVPIMARALQENDLGLYKRTLRSLRWKRIISGVQFQKTSENESNISWWWIVWVLLWLGMQVFRH